MKNMIKSFPALVLIALIVVTPRAFSVPASTLAPHTFRVESGKFALDGKPFQIISGEMHYPAFPAHTGTPGCAWPKRWA
jgi:hypothetical protein